MIWKLCFECYSLFYFIWYTHCGICSRWKVREMWNPWSSTQNSGTAKRQNMTLNDGEYTDHKNTVAALWPKVHLIYVSSAETGWWCLSACTDNFSIYFLSTHLPKMEISWWQQLMWLHIKQNCVYFHHLWRQVFAHGKDQSPVLCCFLVAKRRTACENMNDHF